MSERATSDSDEGSSRAKDWELISDISENLDLDYDNFIFPPSHHEGLPIEIDIANLHLSIEGFENSQVGVEESQNSQVRGEESRNSQLGREEFGNSQVGFDGFGNLNLGSSGDLDEDFGENVENEVEDGELRGLGEVGVVGVSEKDEIGGNEGSGDVDEGFGEGSDGKGAFFGVFDGLKGLGFGCGGVKGLGFGWDGVKGWGWEGWLRRQVDSLGKPNALCSIAMAAALVGIVVLGHKWQREKLKNQHIRQQLCANDEKISELLCQVVQLKEAISGRRQVTVVKNS